METPTLTSASVVGYLVSRGLAREGDEIRVRELGGGVSNVVLLIEWPDFPERRWVVKQSLEKLRVKDDWRSDRTRIYREAESMLALRPVLGEATLPEVIHTDRDNYALVMTAAPAGSSSWKELLLSGKVDLNIARQAGTLLAKMIAASHADVQLQKRFEDRKVFDQLRFDPYYRTTADRHPDVRDTLVALMTQSWSIRSALVHGDYSPKNMLVSDGSIFLIDFEVVHYGDPAFDAGFLLNHLFLKALYKPGHASRYLGAAREFWQALATGMSGEARQEFEALTVRHLGGLMLARIDGKSPVEYIQDEGTKGRVRQVAKRILQNPPRRLKEAVTMVLEMSA